MEAVTAWRTFWRAIALAALLIGLLWIAGAEAQTQCGPHRRIVEVLAGKYGEAPRAIGSVSRNHLMEVYVSETGSWTILVTSADGNACIIASGGDWEDVPFEPGARS
ncbi:MAG: hypothetical protein OEL78_00350 [Hyphomicrobiales bacterium]|nr:hypothetical protein [Hyphomicrobiales bacterium]